MAINLHHSKLLIAEKKRAGFAFGLQSRIILLISSLLLFELTLFSCLHKVLEETESDARQLDRSRRILDKTNQLGESIYVMSNSGAHYIVRHNKQSLNETLAAADNAEKTLAWLEKELDSSRDSLPALPRVRYEMSTALKIARELLSIVHQDGGQVNYVVDLQVARLRSLVESLNNDIILMTDQERKLIDDQEPVRLRKRIFLRQLISLAFVGNVILAIGLTIVLSKTLVIRIMAVLENTERLASNTTLLPRVKGDDEIAKLDSNFHSMAEKLNAESKLLRMSEARVRTIIEQMPVGLLVMDDKGRIDFSNSQVKELFGYAEADLKGCSILKILTANSTQLCPLDLTEALRSGLAPTELTLRRLSGEPIQIEFSLRSLVSDEGPRWLASLFDVSERHEIQALRQSFLMMIGHDIRSPLNSVQAFHELIDMGAFGDLPVDMVRESAGAAHSLKRIISLVNDLLTIECLEAGGLTLNRRLVSADSLVQGALQTVKILADQKGIRLLHQNSVSQPILCDSARIEQVLINLLSNSIKFSPANSTVVVQSSLNKNRYLFAVIDQGPGIPSELQADLFQRFTGDTKVKGRGFGLGLAICKALVEKHGGSIGVSSEPGKGSCFYFELDIQSS
jgi:PAS domain S-box-containing protein